MKKMSKSILKTLETLSLNLLGGFGKKNLSGWLEQPSSHATWACWAP